ncbi:MAG: glycogen/starch/alpha-glucan phosphorylase, partial [Clostridiales bacterium]|nr:glycogen/starch/alpha-glucan phosphorylase [Clostridiales bacterium]
IEKAKIETISYVLYPNDDNEAGKLLRLRQEYFFSAASIKDLVNKHINTFGTIDNFSEYNAIQLNDTHPVIAVPELILQLTRDFGKTFDESFTIAQKVFSYTNHTIMAEALEKWGADIIAQYLPEIYEVIIKLNEKFVSDMYDLKLSRKKIDSMKLIQDGTIHMANIAIYSSSYTNGVAEIHTQILKDTALKDWYKVFPKRFQNKTNGITQRRWLALCNPELSAMITELLGTDKWVTNLDMLKELEKYADNHEILTKFLDIKQVKKDQLSQFILKSEGIKVDSTSIFDIQIKRLHEYKRQLMNAFSILYIYFGIKDGTIKNFNKTTFIFGAKSAPGYKRAKGIIKYINEIAGLCANDPEVKDLIKVVFVSDYRVSYAEKLVSGADISEQISTAGTEASGTGNMKFMLNGTCTLGTYDGANVEIVAEAGEENNYIFGARVEELDKIMKDYDPRKLCSENPKIKRVLNTLIDGTVSDGGTGVFKDLYFSLVDGASWHVADNYYVLGDLESYVEAKLKANAEYVNRIAFAKKCWLNMCNAGKFSSDRTINDYAKNIWKINPIAIE